MYKIDLETLQTRFFTFQPYGFTTTCLHRSQRSGVLYVGSTKGLFIKLDKTDTLTELRLSSLVDQSEIRYIHENSEGLWLCTTQGLFLYDEGRNTCLDYSDITQNTAVNHLYETPEGAFWLGTFGQGLLHWSPGAPSATPYNYQDGLTDEQILAVYPDEYGLLWMPTNNGLIRFDPDTKDAITFTTKDGLPHNEFNLYSHHQTRDGMLVFGIIKGLIKFHPSQFPKEFQNNYAQVRVIRMEKTSPGANTEQLSVNTEAVVLDKSTETLRLQFVLLDYGTTGLEEFDYRVLGQTDQWAPMRNSTLNLSGLPYGDFRLEVRGHTSKESYSKEVYQLRIRVPLPFYRAPWFFLLSIVVLGVLIFFIIRWRTHQLQKEKIHLQRAIRQRTNKIHQQATTLQKLSQAKTSFIANITHELRTPLTMISGALQLLNITEPPKPKSGLKTIERNVDRLIHLVDELIDVNQSEKALLKVKAAPINIKALSTIAFQNYEEEASLQHTQYTLQLSDDLEEIYLGDQQKIEHVIHNLLSNAFKYTPKGGKITLKVYPGKPTGIIIQVEDNGPGISPEVQSRIFERYYQAESSVSGMGLGLSIVQDYVAAMNGQVSLESKPGEGTAFLIALPLQVAQKNGTEAAQGKNINNAAPTPPSDTKGVQPDILIVEDNTEIQSLLVDVFQRQYSLNVMDDGQMALSYLQSATKLPSLIITDLMMPKLDGISFIKILKADHRYSLLPILVLSAVNTPLTKINALTIGVDDYINKPFHIEELRAIATTLLKNAAARLEATKDASDPLPKENAPGDHNISQHKKEWLEKTEAVLWDMVKKGKDIKVKDLASTLHISERQLQRQIKQYVGLTPVEYINEICLQRARQLIDNKTYSTVAEVAYKVGYAYPNYFSKVFTKRFGQPPSHFF